MDDYRPRLMDALRKQHRAVFDYDTGKMKEEFREQIDCPACHGAERVTAFEKDWFVFSRCVKCGMVYLNPRLNDEATYRFYNSEWNSIYNEKKFEGGAATTCVDDRRNDENLRFILQNKPQRGRLLEVGIGNGYFLGCAQEAGFEVCGVELNQRNCELARSVLGGKGTVHNTDLFSAKLPDGSFDVIYLKDVFEHVPNPRGMLAEFNRIAQKGALLFIEVPNIEGLVFKVVGRRHECIFAFEHLNYWSPQSLGTALAAEGFSVVQVQHESDDFTPAALISYLIDSPFTSVQPVAATGVTRLALKAFRRVLAAPPVSLFDGIFRRIPDWTARGSQIKVLATKI